MAYFGKYIRQILSRQESVIFPGFGSLIMIQGKGINTSDGSMDPPGMIIKFDQNHPKSDGKLAEEYAKGEGIDLTESRQQLLELVDAIKFKLDKGEVYDLSLVGIFSRDNDNRILFEKDPNWVIDPEIFGLTSLDLLELDSEDEKEEESDESIVVGEVEEKKSRDLKKKSAASKEAVVKKVERRPVNKWRIIWIVIGSLILVLVLLLLIPTGEGDNDIEFSRDGIILKNRSEKPSESTEEPGVTELETKNIEENVLVSPKDSRPVEIHENTTSESQVKNYFIIAGSFSQMQNAEILMNELKEKGFPAEVIYTENRLYRVSIKSYVEKNVAVSELESIKSRSGMTSAWVWSKN